MSETYKMPFEVEAVGRGDETVEYEIEFSVLPGDHGHGPTYSSGGEPPYPPEVESIRVFLVRKDPKTGKEIREERPELECLVDEDELLEYADERENEYDDLEDPRDSRDDALGD